MVVKLQGGTGNQMFQYAYGITESIRRKEDLFLDTELLDTGNPKREYELGAYVDARFKNDPEAENGYWQNEKFFDAPLIRDIFARPRGPMPDEVRTVARKIKDGCCFVGVRRADYLWPERINFHGVMPVSYYDTALYRLGPKQTICFSDDPKWTWDNLGMRSIRTTPAWDIWLMSLCTHAIIANSTFHWWGAYIGADITGKVYAPKKWFVNEESDIVPSRWITL